MKLNEFNLEDRINRVINTSAFSETLEFFNIDLFEFQMEWKESKGNFSLLKEEYQAAIIAGEVELNADKIRELE